LQQKDSNEKICTLYPEKTFKITNRELLAKSRKFVPFTKEKAVKKPSSRDLSRFIGF